MRSIVILMPLLAACPAPTDPPDAGDLPDDLPAAICRADAVAWKSGQRAFAEKTAEWGLDELGVLGLRMSVTDLDGDGFADVVVRRAGTIADDFAGTTRAVWVLRNTGNKGFADVTQSSGFVARRTPKDALGRPSETIVFGDVDGDGDLDAYSGSTTTDAVKSDGETSELLINDGTGHFTLGPADSPLRHAQGPSAPAGASFADVDLDGDLDLFVGHGAYISGNSQVTETERLYLNDGAGRFTDATEDSGVQTKPWSRIADLNAGKAHPNAWSALAADLNGDLVPELLASSYGRGPNHLHLATLGNGTVSYTNVSVDSGYAFDGNREYVDDQNFVCACDAGLSDPLCDEAGAPMIQCRANSWTRHQDDQPFRLGGNSGATLVGDVDGDGDLDLFTSEIRHWWAGSASDMSELLLNTGEPDVRFTRPGREATGIEFDHLDRVDWDEGVMSGSFLDFDNDGRLDLYVAASDYPGNRGLLFHQKSAEFGFESVPLADGIDHHRSHGILVADFDRDGDLDVLLGHSRSRCGEPVDCYPTTRVRFFENQASERSNFLQLDLRGGNGANALAIGARVLVSAGGRTQSHVVNGGYGHYGTQNDRIVHVGLGDACEATVSIYWPDAGGAADEFTLPAGHRFRISPGARPIVVPVPAP